MLFLLSCLMSYETDSDQTTFGIEQTMAVHHVNFDYGRKSSVKIQTIDNGILAGHGSGNYFKVGKEKFIITAAHVVTDGAAFFIVDSGEPVFLEHIHVDRYMDIAIMKPHRELTSVKPINYRNNKKADTVGMSVNYTGYPSDLPKTSFTGVVSYSSVGYAIMQSWAVPGSSGSVVFDNSGKVVGIVNAVKVAHYGLSVFPRLEENIVYIERMIKYDRKDIVEIIKKWRQEKN